MLGPEKNESLAAILHRKGLDKTRQARNDSNQQAQVFAVTPDRHAQIDECRIELIGRGKQLAPKDAGLV